MVSHWGKWTCRSRNYSHIHVAPSVVLISGTGSVASPWSPNCWSDARSTRSSMDSSPGSAYSGYHWVHRPHSGHFSCPGLVTGMETWVASKLLCGEGYCISEFQIQTSDPTSPSANSPCTQYPEGNTETSAKLQPLKGCRGVVPILSPFNTTVALGFL